MPGIRVAYGYHGNENPLYGRVVFELTDASTNFDGTTQSGSPVTDKTKNTFIRLEGNIGYQLIRPPDSKLTLIAYTGLGYRYWERGLGGQLPYTEDYSWKYLPIGIRTEYRINDKWSGAVDASARIMMDGEMKIKILGSNNPSVTLGNKTGWSIEAPFYYNLSASRSVFIAPWYEYSAIGRSNTVVLATSTGTPVASVYEPASTTYQYGINIGVRLW